MAYRKTASRPLPHYIFPKTQKCIYPHLVSVKPLSYLRQKDDCFIIDILWLGVAKDNILIFDTAALHNKYRHYACPSLTSKTSMLPTQFPRKVTRRGVRSPLLENQVSVVALHRRQKCPRPRSPRSNK